MKYLYGASVQGIQSFIFQTNKLREIVGASELVEQICTTKFAAFCSDQDIEIADGNYIIKAAGNIKYVFDSDTDCAKVVRAFPKYIANLAPGITVSQAVVKIENDNLHDAINQVETKLKAQRSKVAMPVELGFMGLERARKTGGVASHIDRLDDEVICDATHQKRKLGGPEYQTGNNDEKETLFSKISGIAKLSETEIPFDVEKITQSGKNSWLAVVHADGNALGLLLQKLGTSLSGKPYEKVQSAFATFSERLDQATKAAAKTAFQEAIVKKAEFDNEIDNKPTFYPIRPVVLGGDDLTVIIRGDLALDFTTVFLKEFEKETKAQFTFLGKEYEVNGFENGITACAGIVYIKTSYPFHYAVNLAEVLTKKAKNFSKKDLDKSGIPPSSLSFYTVQSSFVESMDDIVEKTLIAPSSKVSFDFGPYLVNKVDGSASVEDLQTKLKTLKEESSKDKSKGISKLRQWISELYKDKSRAAFMMSRMQSVEGNNGLLEKLGLKNPFVPILEKEADSKSPENPTKVKPTQKTIVYDLIQLHSLNY